MADARGKRARTSTSNVARAKRGREERVGRSCKLAGPLVNVDNIRRQQDLYRIGKELAV
jgi:hypothetical protein